MESGHNYTCIDMKQLRGESDQNKNGLTYEENNFFKVHIITIAVYTNVVHRETGR